jgi:hypothetical protein
MLSVKNQKLLIPDKDQEIPPLRLNEAGSKMRHTSSGIFASVQLYIDFSRATTVYSQSEIEWLIILAANKLRLTDSVDNLKEKKVIKMVRFIEENQRLSVSYKS